MKKVMCKSGLWGWQDKLRNMYDDFIEWENYSTTYGLHTRLGYKTPRTAWQANPIIQGSTIPSDFCKVKNG
jgi:hypothetical protein